MNKAIKWPFPKASKAHHLERGKVRRDLSDARRYCAARRGTKEKNKHE